MEKKTNKIKYRGRQSVETGYLRSKAILVRCFGSRNFLGKEVEAYAAVKIKKLSPP